MNQTARRQVQSVGVETGWWSVSARWASWQPRSQQGKPRSQLSASRWRNNSPRSGWSRRLPWRRGRRAAAGGPSRGAGARVAAVGRSGSRFLRKQCSRERNFAATTVALPRGWQWPGCRPGGGGFAGSGAGNTEAGVTVHRGDRDSGCRSRKSRRRL